MNPIIQDVSDSTHAYFSVADHIIDLKLPLWINQDNILPNFKNFIIKNDHIDNQPIISVEVIIGKNPVDTQNATLRSDISITWGDRFRFFETDDHYITRVSAENDTTNWDMVSTKDFGKSTIYASNQDLDSNGILSWLLMVAFGQSSLLHDTVLIHASVIDKDNIGYAFLGKSGTGKSTHARLWLKHIENSKLLNDDNPAIRLFDDQSVFIYGTPWSGKTPCYKNYRVKLGGIVRLEQAAQNEISQKTGTAAMITILPSSTGLRWNNVLFDRMLNNLSTIVSRVSIFHLKCLPNEDAAILSHDTVKNKI